MGNGSSVEIFEEKKRFHFFKGGHPEDMEMAPLRSHFGSTYFFQCTLFYDPCMSMLKPKDRDEVGEKVHVPIGGCNEIP